SRSRHTISYGDWSSDVCSSDLFPCRSPVSWCCPRTHQLTGDRHGKHLQTGPSLVDQVLPQWHGFSRKQQIRNAPRRHTPAPKTRSEERRVGKECARARSLEARE